VPVLDDGFVLPESAVIMEYLDERYPAPPLLPDGAAARAQARVAVFRFDELLGADYYAYRGGAPNELAARLEALPVGESLFVDVAFVPWIVRARELLGVELPARIADWLDDFAQRPAVAAEVDLVRSFV
jgi:glutathione S-transferase